MLGWIGVELGMGRMWVSSHKRPSAQPWAFAGLLLLAMMVAASAQPRVADKELIAALRGGGHVIVMRHTVADPDKGDRDPLNFKNLRAQQPLTDEGRQDAQNFGRYLREIGVPIGEVLTSRFQRCIQTALLAGLRNGKATAELTEGSLVESPNEIRRRAAVLRQLVATPTEPERNRLIVTHRANVTQAFGKEWFDVKEGETSIFKVEAGTYVLVARLQIADWARIAEAAKQQ